MPENQLLFPKVIILPSPEGDFKCKTIHEYLREAYDSTDVSSSEIASYEKELYVFLKELNPTTEMKQEFINKLRAQKSASAHSRRF